MPYRLYGYNKPKIEFYELIAKAGYSKVYKGKTRNCHVAIKRIKKQTIYEGSLINILFSCLSKNSTEILEEEDILQEVEILKMCQSEYVLKFYDTYNVLNQM